MFGFSTINHSLWGSLPISGNSQAGLCMFSADFGPVPFVQPLQLLPIWLQSHGGKSPGRIIDGKPPNDLPYHIIVVYGIEFAA